MAAIITSKFRLDTTNKFVASLADNQFYMALGRPNVWTPSDSVSDTPYENDYTNQTLWENMFAMKKIVSTDIVHSSPRNQWTSSTTYLEYDDQNTDIESNAYFVISENNNVFMCLKSGTGTSTYNPDNIGVLTTGVINDSGAYTGTDGYIWKYMYTVPTSDVTKFLTSSFIPVRRIKSNPATGSDAALINQWSVQTNAIDGAIYNMKITTAGTGYTSAPTLAIRGDGTGTGVGNLHATATCTVSGGGINSITMVDIGKNYTHATITVTGGAGANGAIRPVIGPVGGYGADPTNDLRSHYVTINKAFTGDETQTITDSNDFRQISLIKNPIEQATQLATLSATPSMATGNFYKILSLGDSVAANWVTAGTSDNTVGTVFKSIATTAPGTGTIAQVAEENAYNTCKKLTINTSGSPTFAADAIIEGSDSGAKGQVVEHDTANGLLWYNQNETTGFGVFTTSDNIRLDGGSGGQSCSAVAVPLINHNSGDVMFVENRTATTRATDQVETVRLVIAF